MGNSHVKLERKDHVRADPSLRLNDECMGHIFSFVGNGRSCRVVSSYQALLTQPRLRAKAWLEEQTARTAEEELSHLSAKVFLQQEAEALDDGCENKSYWDVRDAAMCCRTLRMVSKDWKRLVERLNASFFPMPLKLDLNEFANAQQVEQCLSWLQRHGLSWAWRDGQRDRLFGINFDKFQPQWIFGQCDPSKLVSIEFRIYICYAIDPEAKRHLYLLSTKIQEQRDLQHLIAKQCPNIQKLYLRLFVRSGVDCSDVDAELNSELFSLPSIQKIDIDLELMEDDETELVVNHLFRLVLKNLIGLRSLRLTSPSRSFNGELRLESASLEQLVVRDFAHSLIFTLKCPRLETLFQARSQVFRGGKVSPNARVVCVSHDQKNASWRYLTQSHPV